MNIRKRFLFGWSWAHQTAAKYNMTVAEFLRSTGPLKKRRAKR